MNYSSVFSVQVEISNRTFFPALTPQIWSVWYTSKVKIESELLFLDTRKYWRRFWPMCRYRFLEHTFVHLEMRNNDKSQKSVRRLKRSILLFWLAGMLTKVKWRKRLYLLKIRSFMLTRRHSNYQADWSNDCARQVKFPQSPSPNISASNVQLELLCACIYTLTSRLKFMFWWAKFPQLTH